MRSRLLRWVWSALPAEEGDGFMLVSCRSYFMSAHISSTRELKYLSHLAHDLMCIILMCIIQNWKKKHEWITAEEAWMKFSDFLTRNAIYQCRKYWLLATFIIIRLSNWYWPVVVVFVAWHIGMLIFVNFLMQICLMIYLSFSPSLILIDLVCYTDPWAAKLYDISVAVCAV